MTTATTSFPVDTERVDAVLLGSVWLYSVSHLRFDEDGGFCFIGEHGSEYVGIAEAILAVRYKPGARS